jgi:IS5 family transposase
LVKLTKATVERAREVAAQLQHKGTLSAVALSGTLTPYAQLVLKVIEQTVRRVFEHQTVPAQDQVVSLFEPHTAVICRGKPAPHETEFGRKVWFSEVDGGIISEYRLLLGNPPDPQQWKKSLTQHRPLFGHPPQLATGDRGLFSADNEKIAQALGVQQVALPQPGAKDPKRQVHEAQPWFKAALRFRAGIEGRISGLKRARGLDRCLNRGEGGMERWLGWGVIANNLVIIATKLAR